MKSPSPDKIVFETEDCLGQRIILKQRVYDAHTLEGLHSDAEIRRRLFRYIEGILQRPRLILYDQDVRRSKNPDTPLRQCRFHHRTYRDFPVIGGVDLNREWKEDISWA